MAQMGQLKWAPIMNKLDWDFQLRILFIFVKLKFVKMNFN